MTNEQFGPAVNTAAHGDEVRRVGGRGIIASTGVILVVAANAFMCWAIWHGYDLVHAVVYGEERVTFDELDQADRTLTASGWLAIGAALLSGIAFIAWWWRARKNAELICDAPHRRHRAWIIWSWIIPVINLWFPYQLVRDVYRASRPDNPADLYDLREVRRSGLVAGWWGCWLGTFALNLYTRALLRGDLTVDKLHQAAIAVTVCVILNACAALAIILVIRQVSTWQDRKVIFPG